MTIEQAGKIAAANITDYWLLELGYARPLNQSVVMPGHRAFRFQLTNAYDLLEAKNWADLPKRYSVLG